MMTGYSKEPVAGRCSSSLADRRHSRGFSRDLGRLGRTVSSMNQLVPISSTTLPALVAAAGERASMRFLEFFAANIRNSHTRRAYS